ncbi:leucine-responsive regulatory protein [Oxobacter pfennigii]|uniref:Leucine-responsive regulatory protein n=1 Tax=Oxobacter pfennigii TaxID=36849 RepID=A0A0P8WCF3_9CLOT|nr:Lrp/AsnC family transcriptional regulator [Oxobacter pfennigii]KPU45571.1 leucine-responsive regulatory protein [Oxobacter pfennigii]
MDSIDTSILKLLQENSRISISEISSQINLSISAVSERLKKLESSGIIEQYTTIINPVKVGKLLTATMFLNLESPKYSEGFLQFIQSENEIIECYYLAGEYDYILKIITQNTFTLEALLKNIKSIRGVQKTRTIVALSTIKNIYSVKAEEDNL